MAIIGEKRWIVDIKNNLRYMDPSVELEQWQKQCIYLVPDCIKSLNQKAYKPQIVSFGPYHHWDPDLQRMEEQKRRALLHFLKRSDRPLDDFVTGMEEIVQQLLDSYQNLDEKWLNRDRFLQLMIIDGCFMLEVMRVTTGENNDYTDKDPIFSAHGILYIMPYIKRDVLIIENQLPLLVLEKLVSIESGNSCNYNEINKLVLRFCAPNAQPTPEEGLGLHPLDLFHKSLLTGPRVRSLPTGAQVGSEERQKMEVSERQKIEVSSKIRTLVTGAGARVRSVKSQKKKKVSSEIIGSAVELYEAGIKFKKSKTNNLHDISFHRGVLSLPVMVVDDAIEYMFLNLMAFERLHVGAGNEVTSYVFFMDNIIDSAKDVSLLRSKDIIQNAVGSDKAVAKLFNSLSKDVVLDPNSNLAAVHQNVSYYSRKRWNTWKANLIHTYFRSPWAFLSLAAAIFLIGLTVAQTVYTVYPYYHPRPQPDSSTPSIAAPSPR